MNEPSERKIEARVHPDAILRVAQFFKASFSETLSEILQNARRSKATRVAIEIGDDGAVTVTDNGAGVADPQTLLSFGESRWNEQVENDERPAGMGIYALARWNPGVRSRTAGGAGWAVTLDEDHFTGKKPATVEADEHAPAPHGTAVRIESDKTFRRRQNATTSAAAADPVDSAKREKLEDEIARASRYYPLPVHVNGKPAKQKGYLDDARYVTEWQGLGLGVYPFNATEARLGHQRHEIRSNDLNFYGHVISDREMPKVFTVDGDAWVLRVDARGAPGLELTLPAREHIIEGSFKNALHEKGQRVIYEAMAAEAEPVDLSFEEHQNAAALGLTLPEPRPRLAIWTGDLADYSNPYGERAPKRVPVLPGDIVMSNSLSASESQALEQALQGTPIGKRLRRSNMPFAGCGWYDQLPKITKVATMVRWGENTLEIPNAWEDTNDPSDVMMPEGRPDEIVMLLTTQEPGGEESQVRIPAEVAFWQSNDDETWPRDIDILVTKNARIDDSTVGEMLEKGFFSPGQDTDCDSWETQRESFRAEAQAAVTEALDKPDEAMQNIVAQLAWRHLLPEVKRGKKATIEIRRGDKPDVTVRIEADTGNEAPTAS